MIGSNLQVATTKGARSTSSIWIFFLFFLVWPDLICGAPVQAEERITSFISQVDVLPDGQLVVAETITVVAEGNRIRRGIYRDFPTDYSDDRGHAYRVRFSVVSVERDGSSEPFHTQKVANGVRVYMGAKDVIIPHGFHTYTLRYITSRQIGYFVDHDELYWNVTGNGWSFAIEQAAVTVTLPSPGNIQDFQLYTGRSGSRQAKGRLVERDTDSITLETTAPLAAGEGLTVVVSWPKGLIKQPGSVQQGFWLLRDNFTTTSGFIGLLVLIGYFIFSWNQVGRDPRSGPVIPLFTPPGDISPAAGRFILKMGFDQKSFAAVLVNMAVKGRLKIEQKGDEYTLHLLTRGVERLTSGERAVQKKLFAGDDTLKLEQKNNSVIRAAVSGLKKTLRRDLVNTYFKENRARLVPGILISLFILLMVVLSGDDFKETAFITLWMAGWSTGVMVLFIQMVRAWRAALIPGSDFAAKKRAAARTLFFLPFFAGLLMGTFVLLTNIALPALLILLLTLTVNFLFAWLLKAPTLSGRKIMDQLEGLRMYMSVAEKERLNMFNPPNKTPELFEQLLPWALALDVEQQWCAQFAEILDQAGMKEGSYQPLWYSSSHGFSSSSFSSALGGSLSASIASSATAPGSSSGFSSGGGGGFSGGGGGGGGGGGW